MNAATTRSIIAAAGLAAMGLLAWPQQAMPPGAPTVHRDVALVDADSTLLGDEGTFDNALWNDVLGPTGAEETLYTDLGSNAQADLDTFGASPAYSGDFNGAESRLFEGLFLNGLASEDQINQALGVTDTASQTELLGIFNTDFVPIPSGADLTAADLASAVGSSTFDTDLSTIANADLATGYEDLLGYADYLSTSSSSLGDLSTVLTDLTSSLDTSVSGLGTDLTTLLGDLGGLI